MLLELFLNHIFQKDSNKLHQLGLFHFIFQNLRIQVILSYINFLIINLDFDLKAGCFFNVNHQIAKWKATQYSDFHFLELVKFIEIECFQRSQVPEWLRERQLLIFLLSLVKVMATALLTFIHRCHFHLLRRPLLKHLLLIPQC